MIRELLALAAAVSLPVAAPPQQSRYRLKLGEGTAVDLITPDAGIWRFRGQFTVIAAGKDPKLALRRDASAPDHAARYSVSTWIAAGTALGRDAALGSAPRAREAGDGFDNRILKGDREGRTADLFHAGPVTTLEVIKTEKTAAGIRWVFPDHPGFTLEALIASPAGNEEPRLEVRFTPKREAWYSVGYTGAPETNAADAKEIWQPLIWTEKRFPQRSYLTMAFHCPIPAAMVTIRGSSIGVAADAKEFPFDPLPTQENNRFGVAVRNAAGKAQPMVFAPVLGGPESHMSGGQLYKFDMRLFAVRGAVPAAAEQLARRLYGFRDCRRNASWSLNQTLDNMIDYGLSKWSWFNEELKGPSYETDVPGAVKNVSSLHPLSIALVTDDPEIYRRRALPILEFILSRNNMLFSLKPGANPTQVPARSLGGPCARLSELAALHSISKGATPAFLQLAQHMYGQISARPDSRPTKAWPIELALYRATGERAYLDRARAGVDAYVSKRVAVPQTEFADQDSDGSSFWTGFAPEFMKLLELYEATGEQRYLDASVHGARRYAMFLWMTPAIPGGEILVNKGGKAPLYWYLAGKGHAQMSLPEESVPAWRMSEIGLACEAAATSAGHRGVMLANHGPWMLRLGYYGKDAFLHDLGRSTVIGRYANFPGYHINTARTTAYEKPDYPLRPFKELSVNSFHYNHIWPQIALVLDYLVTDAITRSERRIYFPSQYAEGYAYLQSKVYGDRPGEFYGHKDAVLWMPRRLLAIDNPQLNYLAARSGDNQLLLAFTNQSPERISARVKLDGDLAEAGAGARVSALWEQNRPARPGRLANGGFSVDVAPMGITAVALEGVSIRPRFQQAALAPAARPWREGLKDTDLGGARAMILEIGDGPASAFVFLRATDSEFSEVRLACKTDRGSSALTDTSYPFEFTVPLEPGASRVELKLTGVTADGQTHQSTPVVFER